MDGRYVRQGMMRATKAGYDFTHFHPREEFLILHVPDFRSNLFFYYT